MNRESLERVWAPKAAGALRLHEASVGRPSRLVGGVLLGSVACSAHPDRRPMRVPARGSMPSWPGAVRTDCPPPRSTGDRGRTWVSLARLSAVCSTRSPPPRGSRPSESLLATDRTMTGVARLRTDRAMVAVPGDPRTGLLRRGGRGIGHGRRRRRLGRCRRTPRTRSR